MMPYTRDEIQGGISMYWNKWPNLKESSNYASKWTKMFAKTRRSRISTRLGSIVPATMFSLPLYSIQSQAK